MVTRGQNLSKDVRISHSPNAINVYENNNVMELIIRTHLWVNEKADWAI